MEIKYPAANTTFEISELKDCRIEPFDILTEDYIVSGEKANEPTLFLTIRRSHPENNN